MTNLIGAALIILSVQTEDLRFNNSRYYSCEAWGCTLEKAAMDATGTNLLNKAGLPVKHMYLSDLTDGARKAVVYHANTTGLYAVLHMEDVTNTLQQADMVIGPDKDTPLFKVKKYITMGVSPTNLAYRDYRYQNRSIVEDIKVR